MNWFHRISSLVKNLFRKDRVERDLDEEVRAHLGMLVDEKIAAGLSPIEARRAALIELGGGVALDGEFSEWFVVKWRMHIDILSRLGSS